MVYGVVEVQDSRRRLIMVVVGVCVSLWFVILFCSRNVFGSSKHVHVFFLVSTRLEGQPRRGNDIIMKYVIVCVFAMRPCAI